MSAAANPPLPELAQPGDKRLVAMLYDRELIRVLCKEDTE